MQAKLWIAYHVRGRLLFIPLFLLLLLMPFLSACVTSQSIASQKSTLSKIAPAPSKTNNQTVILLHGMSRTSRSMRTMSKALSAEGYRVCSIDYPSRYFSVEVLATDYVLPRISECLKAKTKAVNFVTHSLGGILIRQLDEELKAYPRGRLVMLSPPNQGSEAVDILNGMWAFQQIAGPAGNELGTSDESLPQTLPAPSMPFAVIAARHSNSAMSFLIPGDDDGKVSIEKMQLPEMSDFVIVDSTHSFMMRNAQTITHVLEFFKTGRFTKN